MRTLRLQPIIRRAAAARGVEAVGFLHRQHRLSELGSRGGAFTADGLITTKLDLRQRCADCPGIRIDMTHGYKLASPQAEAGDADRA